MHVCNLSLGTTKSHFFGVLHELADLAYFRRVVLVTAANNMPRPSFPSVYASVISVASHDEPNSERFYYNPQAPVEFGARGINVRVPWQDGGWVTSTGNSFAAPHITGLVVRILGKHPSLTPFQLKAVLRALAANVSPEDTNRGAAEGDAILPCGRPPGKRPHRSPVGGELGMTPSSLPSTWRRSPCSAV